MDELGERLRWKLAELVRPSWVFVLDSVALLLVWLVASIASWWFRGHRVGNLRPFSAAEALVPGSIGLGLIVLLVTPAAGHPLPTLVRQSSGT